MHKCSILKWFINDLFREFFYSTEISVEIILNILKTVESNFEQNK